MRARAHTHTHTHTPRCNLEQPRNQQKQSEATGKFTRKSIHKTNVQTAKQLPVRNADKENMAFMTAIHVAHHQSSNFSPNLLGKNPRRWPAARCPGQESPPPRDT